MKRCRAVAIAILWLWSPLSGAREQAPDSAAQETAWLATKPVVRYAIDPNWAPLEYVDNGRPQGLTIEVLRVIGERTGIRFIFVPTRNWQESLDKFEKGEVELLPGTTARWQFDGEAGEGLAVYPYYQGSTTVVSRGDGATVIDPQSLAGLRVAVGQYGATRDWIERTVSTATVLPFDSVQKMLDAVVAGEADVAVGPEIVLLPQLRRSYRGELNIAGSLPQLPVELSMVLRPGETMLRSVLDKAVKNLTALQTDEVFEKWYGETDFGRPNIAALVQYYWLQAILAVLVAALLVVVAVFSIRARRAATRAEYEKSRFLAVMSHEIRTALNAVVGPIDVLSHAPDHEDRPRLLHTARIGSQMLLHTVNNLLDLSKLQARKMPLLAQPMSVDSVVREVAMATADMASAKQLAVHVIVPSTLYVSIDGYRYRQVLMNLVTNAIKFTQQGRVSIRVELDRSHTRASLRTYVDDTGVGLHSDAIANLFTEYGQLGEADERRSGTGLGLVICKEIVQGMGGRISVKSAVGEGTTVEFELPVLELDAAAVAATMPGTPVIETKPQRDAVLVIDDNEINRRVLADQLALLGYRSHLCEGGESGLAAWREHHYSLVLLDCQMPVRDGYQVSRIMRDEEAAAELEPTVILALSARSEAAHTAACFDAGMNGVLTKPVDTEVLGNTLKMWTGLGDEIVQRSGAATATVTTPGQESLAAAFHRTCRVDVTAMRDAIGRRSAGALVSHAHRIKGAALVLEKNDVARLAGFMETAPTQTSEDWSRLAGAVERLDAMIEDRSIPLQ